jgi:CheY-like chemotaxis protein
MKDANMSRNVIITEDDPVSLFLHKIFVQKAGLSNDPLCFASAVETLQYLRAHFQSGGETIILLDINMPGMTGWEFLDQIKEYEGIRVIVVSSSVNQSDLRKAQSYSQVFGYAEKPLSAAMLLNLMESDDFKASSKRM